MLNIICKDKIRFILCPEKQFNIDAQRSENKLQLYLPLLGELREEGWIKFKWQMRSQLPKETSQGWNNQKKPPPKIIFLEEKKSMIHPIIKTVHSGVPSNDVTFIKIYSLIGFYQYWCFHCFMHSQRRLLRALQSSMSHKLLLSQLQRKYHIILLSRDFFFY